MEVTLNETSMTAEVDFNWEAPTAYWNEYAGANVLLPNGDFMGDFGDPTHEFPQNSENEAGQSWSFNNTGAVFAEVNSTGQVVRTFTFPVGCYVYRVETVTNPSSVNFASNSLVNSTSSPAPTPVVPSTPIFEGGGGGGGSSEEISPTEPPVTTPSPIPTPASPTPTTITTPTPVLSTSSPPKAPINVQTPIIIIVIAVAIAAVAASTVLLQTRKRRQPANLTTTNTS